MSPLLIRLENNSITNESFTHLHSYLTTRAGWRRSPDQEEGQKPYTKYQVTKSYKPGENVICSVTIFIYDYSLGIHVRPMNSESQERIYSSNYCFEIKEEISNGLSKYQEIDQMEFLYFCSSHKSSGNCPYYARIEDSCFKCTRTDHTFEPQDNHNIWFEYNFFLCNGMYNSEKFYFAWDFYYLKHIEQSQDAEKGIGIAIIDTGIDSSHPAFRGKIMFIGNQTLEGITNTDCNHGTAVAGVAVGRHLKRSDCALLSPNRIGFPPDQELPIGVAPQDSISLVVFKVANTFDGPYDNAEIISALKTIKQHNTTADAKRKARVRIIVMPFKLKKKDKEIEEQIKSLHMDQEVLFLVSAGNHGFSRGLRYPATSEHVLTIGSSTSNSLISPFSSRPISKSQYKDILYVLGEYVLVPATKKGKDWGGWPYYYYYEDEGENNCFLKLNSGTSFSAAAMAGLIAILMQHQVKPDKKTSDTVVASWTAFFKHFEEKNLDEKHKPDPGVIIPLNFKKIVTTMINT